MTSYAKKFEFNLTMPLKIKKLQKSWEKKMEKS